MEPVHKLLQPSLGGDEDDDDLSVKGRKRTQKSLPVSNIQGRVPYASN